MLLCKDTNELLWFKCRHFLPPLMCRVQFYKFSQGVFSLGGTVGHKYYVRYQYTVCSMNSCQLLLEYYVHYKSNGNNLIGFFASSFL